MRCPSFASRNSTSPATSEGSDETMTGDSSRASSPFTGKPATSVGISGETSQFVASAYAFADRAVRRDEFAHREPRMPFEQLDEPLPNRSRRPEHRDADLLPAPVAGCRCCSCPLPRFLFTQSVSTAPASAPRRYRRAGSAAPRTARPCGGTTSGRGPHPAVARNDRLGARLLVNRQHALAHERHRRAEGDAEEPRRVRERKCVRSSGCRCRAVRGRRCARAPAPRRIPRRGPRSARGGGAARPASRSRSRS